MWSRVRPQAASASPDQRRAPTSSQRVPEASDISLTHSPVSCRRNQSFGSNTRAVWANRWGSCSRIHNSLGAVKPGIAKLPAMACSVGSAASSAAHCAPLRPSFHRIAGRSTVLRASISTAPCICPASPIARTAAIADESLTCRRCIATSSAYHQSAGACSLHSGCGRDTVSGSPTLATMLCRSSSSSSLSSDVPRSMPRYTRDPQPPRPKRWSAWRLNSLGVMPFISRKRRLKFATLLNPTS